MWHKGWQNSRSGWTRRVRWFNLYDGNSPEVRLEFVERMPDNSNRETWKVTVTRTEAQKLWDEYIADEMLSALDIYIRVMEEQGA